MRVCITVSSGTCGQRDDAMDAQAGWLLYYYYYLPVAYAFVLCIGFILEFIWPVSCIFTLHVPTEGLVCDQLNASLMDAVRQ